MRLLAILLVAALGLVVAPVARAEDRPDASTLGMDEFLVAPIPASTTARVFVVVWDASVPIDVFAVSPDAFAEYNTSLSWTVPSDAFLTRLNTTSGRGVFVLPAGVGASVIFDNTALPDDGAPPADLEVEWILTERENPPGGVLGFVRTALFLQPFVTLPFAPGTAIASEALLFLAMAIGAEAVARREDKWRLLDIGIMIGAGVVSATFIAGDGIVLPDTRLLTIPAIVLGIIAMRRYRTRVAAACGVFAAAFWGPFIGSDILSLSLHAEEVARLAAEEGHVYVIGGAGFADGLVIVPLLALASFAVRASFLRPGRAATPSVPTQPPQLRLASPLEVVASRVDLETVLLRVSNPNPAGAWQLRLRIDAGGGQAHDAFLAGHVEPRSSAELRAKIPPAVAASPNLRGILRCGGQATTIAIPDLPPYVTDQA